MASHAYGAKGRHYVRLPASRNRAALGYLVRLADKGGLGWFGVSISPFPLEAGNEDLIEHVKLDPSHDKDRDAFIALNGKSGGLVPKPKEFMLAFVNTVFCPLDPEPDSDEELGAFGETKDEPKEDEDGLDSFGEDVEEAETKKPKAPTTPQLPSWVRAKNPTVPTEAPPEQVSSASGYGKLGVTRYASVRKRLRA
eukprot:CAMPEP_0115662434 /NCGR_PEP_ID=MMETSP0272-20121206/47309_1 /TAXON_ID=71861 /ORGANISM="Scrippsiella trochoidea, Strain CCMP3099" /LENGTH=195 /DNA_ID=CAMNT_0003100723 /DNA_START=82 /DNA_END=666 /DNA_ORIENTATION=-